ncbi:hypothetical protein Syun_005236 [Stephania yunnanensis]|uniref:Cyclin-like domain-containing protein n=1 Tax=Stephania yunnanensis TaxID=152371 RepID=A0AAP0Q396_9MAGN
MDDFDPPRSPPLLSRSLLCPESLFSSDDDEDAAIILETETLCSTFHNQSHFKNDEYIKTLVAKETNQRITPPSSLNEIASWLKSARSAAVQWIAENQVSLGFRCQTAYLAVLYCDRYLSNLSAIDVLTIKQSRTIELLGIVCLWIAAKVEEGTCWPLSHVLSPDFKYKIKFINKVELLVLTVLDWRMTMITPFYYLHFFISKFGNESQLKDLVSRAVEHILAFMKVASLMDHSSYAIAAAAILATLDPKLSESDVRDKMGLLSLSAFLKIDHVVACYIIMLQSKASLDGSSIHRDRETKRRRLAFDGSSSSGHGGGTYIE